MSSEGLTWRSSGRVTLADKVCNLRDILASPPKGWSIERKRQYFNWAKRVIDQVRGDESEMREAV